NDQVGGLYRAMNKVARRQGRTADKPGVTFIDHALAELSGKERDAGLLDELKQHPAGHGAISTSADHQDWRLGLFKRMHRSAYRLHIRIGPPRVAALERYRFGFFVSDVLGKLNMRRARLLLF